MTALQHEKATQPLPFKQYVCAENDGAGLLAIEGAVEEFKPDVIFATNEPGGLTSLASFTPPGVPVVAYTVVEGEPVLKHEWRNMLRDVNVLACSQYGQRILKRDVGIDVKYAYHGVDTDVFHPDEARRLKVRSALGWANKFVVMCVAQNVRRKQHPRLFEAIRILRDDFKQNDVVLYDHTVPFMQHWMEGWHLPELSDSMGLHDAVAFNPGLTGWHASVPEVSTLGLPGLADLYRAADLFVLPSQVEGFGLPIAEAMASGTPVLVTKYAAGWEVASPAGAGIPVYDWELAKSGVRYANVSPRDIAKSILDLKRDPKRRARMSAAGLERVKDFSWDVFKEAVVDACENAAKAQADGRQEDASSLLGGQEPAA